MGKAKGKVGGAGRAAGAPYGKDKDTRPKGESSGIVSDLTSLDEQRRINACRLISGVFEASSGASFEAVVTPQLLAALAMRLVDASVAVRVDAAGAIRNMACSGNAAVVRRMAAAGMARTLLGLLASCGGGGGGAAADKLFQGRISEQLLGGLAGLLAHCDEASEQLLEEARAVPLLLQLVSGLGGPGAAVRRGAADVLATATDGNAAVSERVLAAGGLDVLRGAVGGASSPDPDPAAAQATIACCSVLVNLFSGATDEQVRQGCGLQAALGRLVDHAALPPAALARLLDRAASAAAQGGEREDEGEGDAENGMDVGLQGAVSAADAEEEQLLQALAVAKAAAEVLANAAILLPARPDAASAAASSQQLLAFCTGYNLFGAVGFALLQHHELLLALTRSARSAVCALSLAVAENIDTLCAVLVNLAESNTGSLQGNEEVLGHVARLAGLLVTCVQSTLTTVDAAGKRSSEWAMDVDVASPTATMKMFALAAASALGFVASVLRTAELRGHVDDAFVKTLLALLLRGLALPVYSVASVCVLIIADIGSRSVPVNAVLTNALLKKIEAPLVFKERQAENGSVVNWDASVLMVARSVDAVIDIHSSDDEGLLSNFVKLNVASKLRDAISLLIKKMNSEDAQKLDTEEKTSMAEVIENATNFLEYKSQFCK